MKPMLIHFKIQYLNISNLRIKYSRTIPKDKDPYYKDCFYTLSYVLSIGKVRDTENHISGLEKCTKYFRSF